MNGTRAMADAWLRRLALPVLIAVLSPGSDPAHAAVFNVADGDVAGLAAAINAANDVPEAHVINLAAWGTYTLTGVNNGGPGPAIDDGATGLPMVASQITI